MHQAYIVTGSIADGRTVKLDEPLPFKEGKVRIVVEVLSAEGPSLREVLEQIHQGQRERGYVPPSREEVGAYLKAE